MAEIIEFPDTAPEPTSAYWLHRHTPDGGRRNTVLIRARDDADARRQAYRLADGLQAELWSSDQLLDHFAAADHPIAVSVRLLGDPATVSET